MSSEFFRRFREDLVELERFSTAFAMSMDKKPSDGGWTASQCLAHIADAEISLALRLRMMLTADDYNFTSWDEDAFAAIKSDRDSKISAETIKLVRLGNIEILESLSPGQLARTGIRPNGERISVIDYADYMSNHLRVHLEQAVKAAQA